CGWVRTAPWRWNEDHEDPDIPPVAALADGLGQHARVGAAAAARMGPAQPRPARNPDRAHARPLEQLTRAPPAHLRPCAQLAADDARATRTSTSRHASLRTHGTAAAP